MKKAVIPFFLLAIISFFSGCASDIANRYYLDHDLASKPVDQVEVLWEKPVREFTVIADFQSRGESPKKLRKKAAAIGADAVIISTLGGYYSHGEQWAGKDKHDNSYSRITGTAIIYK